MKPLGDSTTHFWRAQSMAQLAHLDLQAAISSHCLTQEGWADIVTTCRGCSWDKGCKRWLTLHRRDLTCDVPETCDNYEEFSRLKRAVEGH